MSRVRLLVLAVGWVGLACGACSSPPEKSGYITQGVGLTEGQKKLVPVFGVCAARSAGFCGAVWLREHERCGSGSGGGRGVARQEQHAYFCQLAGRDRNKKALL